MGTNMKCVILSKKHIHTSKWTPKMHKSVHQNSLNVNSFSVTSFSRDGH